MCLTGEFFDEREEALKQYIEQGYVGLQEFLDENSWKEDQLWDCGLVESKGFMSTADLYDFKLTVKGRRYLKSDRRNQLFLVKDVEKLKRCFVKHLP